MFWWFLFFFCRRKYIIFLPCTYFFSFFFRGWIWCTIPILYYTYLLTYQLFTYITKNQSLSWVGRLGVKQKMYFSCFFPHKGITIIIAIHLSCVGSYMMPYVENIVMSVCLSLSLFIWGNNNYKTLCVSAGLSYYIYNICVSYVVCSPYAYFTYV